MTFERQTDEDRINRRFDERTTREKLLEFYKLVDIYGGVQPDFVEFPKLQLKKKSHIEKIANKITKLLLGALVLEVLYVPIILAFGDRLKSERYIERTEIGESVVLLRKQDRPAYIWPVYQVTALNKDNKIVYDEATGLKRVANSHFRKARNALENIEGD